MKKVILPVVSAVAMLVFLLNVNDKPETAGYVISIGIGLLVGTLLNKLVFKEKATADFTQAKESIVNENDKPA